MPSTCFELREQLHYLFFPCSLLGRLHGVCFYGMTLLRTALRHCDSATFQRCSCPVLRKSAILGTRCKPGEQLHYLFFPCSPVGSPSWCLFLYDIVAHLYTTDSATFRRCSCPVLATGKAAILQKRLFWAHAASQGNNCITCSFRAVLLGRLHGVCFLRVDIDAHPYATATVLRLNAASPPYNVESAILGAHCKP